MTRAANLHQHPQDIFGELQTHIVLSPSDGQAGCRRMADITAATRVRDSSARLRRGPARVRYIAAIDNASRAGCSCRSLIAAIDLEGRELGEVVQEWLDANAAIWQAWTACAG